MKVPAISKTYPGVVLVPCHDDADENMSVGRKFCTSPSQLFVRSLLRVMTNPQKRDMLSIYPIEMHSCYLSLKIEF